MKKRNIKQIVREGYAKAARACFSCCGPKNSCCSDVNSTEEISKIIGYSDGEMKAVPEGANLGLGCGNPVAIASLREGEVVLDLGAGAGFDVFLAAAKVGKTGRVIGVDMTPEMVVRAAENARKGNYSNVEFILGEIEKLPTEDNFVDVIISNCAINLSLGKRSVFKEAFRVLKPGGRMIVSDLVLTKELPDIIKESVEAYVGCLAGAVKKEDYIKFIEEAGFKEIKVLSQVSYLIEAMANDAAAKALIRDAGIKGVDLKIMENSVVSVKIHALKVFSVNS